MSVFAYGTLKSDQLRASMWPRRPERIEAAITRGLLWDLGSYPGLCLPDNPQDPEAMGTQGLSDNWVLGELWTFKPEDLPKTFEVLDQIEGYDASSDSGLYLRREIDVRILAGPQQSRVLTRSWVYVIPDLRTWPQARRIQAWEHSTLGSTLARWPDAHARVPRHISQED